MTAELADLVRLEPDVIGVTLDPGAVRYFPGQYTKVQFRGFPARCYSPTYPMAGRATTNLLYFHIRDFKDGRCRPRSDDIEGGHQVRVTGPFGTHSSGGTIPAESCWLRAAPGLRRCGRSRRRQSPRIESARWSSSRPPAACSRSTCTMRVPARTVSERQDHADRVGAAGRDISHPQWPADRSPAGAGSERRGLYLRRAGNDRAVAKIACCRRSLLLRSVRAERECGELQVPISSSAHSSSELQSQGRTEIVNCPDLRRLTCRSATG